MSGGSSTPVSQTTTSQPSKQQRELLNLALPPAREFAANPPQYFPESTVAPFNPTQIAGQEQVLGAVPAQQGIVGGAGSAINRATSGEFLDPNSNPALRATIDAATRPITEQLLERALPAVRSGAVGAGQYGSNRQGLAEAAAIRDAGRNVGDTAAKISTAGYQAGLDALLKGSALAPSIAGAQTIPGLTTSGVGDVRQGMEQALLGDEVARFNYGQNLPLLTAKELTGLAAGTPGGSTTTTATTPQANPLTASLGGAASGAALGSTFGPWGAVAGGGIGALLPWIT